MAAWNAGSVLAVKNGPRVHLYDAAVRSTDTIRMFRPLSRSDPTSELLSGSADGSGFIVRHNVELPYEYGTLGLDGTFEKTTTQPPILQSTGAERRWGADWSEAGMGCPTEGGPPGCSIYTDIGGGEITTWYEEDDGLGRILEVEWDASGHGLWLTVDLERNGASVKDIALMHAFEPTPTAPYVVTFPMELSADDNPGLSGCATPSRSRTPTCSSSACHSGPGRFCWPRPATTSMPSSRLGRVRRLGG